MSELYREAASILQGLIDRKGGFKSLAYSEEIVNKRSAVALVSETLKFKAVLDEILSKVPQSLTNELKKVPVSQVYVALYDLLFGHRKTIQGGGKLKKQLMKHENALRTTLVRIKIKRKVALDVDLLPIPLRTTPALSRYARVNTLKTTVKDVLVETKPLLPTIDTDIPNLLKFPPSTELHEHPLVSSGKLILQDKASCFPAHILLASKEGHSGGDVIDACAAPGNKTSHLAAILNSNCSKNQVFAFDRSSKRLDLLKSRMKAAGALENDLVVAELADFLSVNPLEDKYRNVTRILLDPSCSGSGMSNRLDHVLDNVFDNNNMSSNNTEDEGDNTYSCNGDERVTQLADFQVSVIKKAFTFPNVKMVSYSTCSVFIEENEAVVSKVLKEVEGVRLLPCLPTWKRRGLETEFLSEDQRQCVVRAIASKDGINGFFVALFERGSEIKKELTESQRARKKRKRQAQKAKKNKK